MPTANNNEQELDVLGKYIDTIMAALNVDKTDAGYGEIYSAGLSTFQAVSDFLLDKNAIVDNPKDNRLALAAANESLSCDAALGEGSDLGTQFVGLFDKAKLHAAYRPECSKMILNIMNRSMGRPTMNVWEEQSMKVNPSNSKAGAVRSLEDIYTADTFALVNGTVRPSTESFGVNIDTATPDLRVSITVAIMQFHTRLLPRIIPTKSINQPEVSYVKEYQESFDLNDFEQKGKTLLDLTVEPEDVTNELKRIVPLMVNAKDKDADTLVADNVIKFNKQVNLFHLSVDETRVGFTRTNRTDLVAENVKIESVLISFGGEQFLINVPLSKQRLVRTKNNGDVDERAAVCRFAHRMTKKKNNKTSDGADSAVLSSLGDNDAIVISFQLQPVIALKSSVASCTAIAEVKAINTADPRLEPSDDAKTIANQAIEFVGYTLDARFSEENTRKSDIAIWSNRQEFSYDIPIGRNYIYDYPIGGENADQNATNLTKVIGIGQDHFGYSKVIVRTLQDVADRIAVVGPRPKDRAEYVGASYVAGDKVRPVVYQGVLDFSNLNVVRDADRPGDIKQKALTYLNAITTNVIYDSQILYQLDGAGVTFRCVTSMTVLGKILSQPHIHNHMDKEDARDLGDGVEYVLCLPNGVRIEIVTTPFLYGKDRLVMVPIIKNNAESEMNFAMNYDYGTLVAHYTPGQHGSTAFHRLFANIRELPIVTNPVGIIVDIEGMDYVNDIVDDGVYLHPTVNIQTNGKINVSGEVSEGENGAGTGSGDGTGTGTGDGTGTGAGTGTGTGTNP